jgi:hypothetical protein
MVTSPAR